METLRKGISIYAFNYMPLHCYERDICLFWKMKRNAATATIEPLFFLSYFFPFIRPLIECTIFVQCGRLWASYNSHHIETRCECAILLLHIIRDYKTENATIYLMHRKTLHNRRRCRHRRLVMNPLSWKLHALWTQNGMFVHLLCGASLT